MHRIIASAALVSFLAGAAWADGHAVPSVTAADQDVSNGIVSAREVVAPPWESRT